MKLAILVLTLTCVAVAAFSGYVRFGAMAAAPPIWLDVLFLVSTATLLALCVTFLISKLHSLGGSVSNERRQADRSDPRRK